MAFGKVHVVVKADSIEEASVAATRASKVKRRQTIVADERLSRVKIY